MTTGHKRRQRRRRLALWGGAALALCGLLLLTFLVAPSFTFTSLERTPSEAPPAPQRPSAQPAPTPTPTMPSLPSVDTNQPVAHIAIAGDTGTRDKNQFATARRMELEAERKGEPYDALVILGDLIYPDGDAALTDASVTRPFAGTLDDAELVPALGNHDVQSGEGMDIMRRLGRNTAWYVDQFGPLRIVVVDSNRVDNAEQTRWLRGVLADEQPAGTWTIVAMHHAPYSAGHHGSDKRIQRRWVPMFVQADIPIVFAGHDHDYQRSRPQNGVTYVVSGGAAKLREAGREAFTAVSTSKFHFVDLVVYDDWLEGRAIDQRGNAIDEFTIGRG